MNVMPDWKYQITYKWHNFSYNYRWSDYVKFIDGWLAKFAFFFPIVGYLILFNDEISSFFRFENIAKTNIEFGLDYSTRLHLLYFGLFFLGISNLIYRLKRPKIFKYSTDVFDYVSFGLEQFVRSDYIQIHSRIREYGNISLDGKYYDSEWDGFLDLSSNTDEGRENVVRNGNWQEAKHRYGNLLRSMLRDNFYYLDKKRRAYLTICLIFSFVGYIFLIIPSGDLFFKVLVTIFS